MSNIRSYTLVMLLLVASNVCVAQLVVDPSLNAQQMIEDVLIGQGVQVSNFQYNGNAAASGYFDGSSANLGLSAGIILSSGRVVDAVGPNVSTAGSPAEEGTNFNGPGDTQLATATGSTAGTYDAAILEFDFIPSSDSVQFRYVFASNEYMYWVSTPGINDAFAFLLSGPGIGGTQNIALVPGTTTPITMVDINANNNAQYYVDNGDDPGEEGAPAVNYNGFTTVMTALAILEPCQTYHLKLVLADGGDGLYDSAVFLEAGSFTSPSISLSAESSYSASQTAEVLVEGCSSMTMTFERSGTLSSPLSVGLTLTGTATNGADISNIPTTINFAAGESTASISFNVLEDGQAEGTETMTVTLDQLNPCSTGASTSVSFSIVDAQEMTLQITPSVALVCPEESIITVTPTGGYPPYSYDWSGSSDTDASITVFPLSTTNYNVVVTDACGFTELAGSTITLDNYQILEVDVANAIVCNGEEVTLIPLVTGGLGTLSFLWNGSSTDSLYTFSPSADTQVTLQVTDGCNISENTTATVSVDHVQATFSSQLIGHATVEFTTNTVDVVSFEWNFGDDSLSLRENPTHEYVESGTYTVTLIVTNENGCVDTLRSEVTVYDPLHVYLPNSFTPNGDGLNDVFGVVGEGYLYYDLEIYDSWGKRIRQGRFTDSEAWDGTLKGQLVPSGAYVYRIYVQPPIGIEVKEAGVVFVLSGQ